MLHKLGMSIRVYIAEREPDAATVERRRVARPMLTRGRRGSPMSSRMLMTVTAMTKSKTWDRSRLVEWDTARMRSARVKARRAKYNRAA